MDLICPNNTMGIMDMSDNAINYNMSGLYALQQGDLANATMYLLKAIELDPCMKDAWCNLGTIYGMQAQYDAALPMFKKAYALDSDYKNAIYGLAATYKNLGRSKVASLYCNEYIQKYGSDEPIKAITNQLNEQKVQDKASMDLQRDSNTPKASMHIVNMLEDALIREGYKRGILPQCVSPNIPEIWARADDAMNDLYCGILGQYPANADSLSIYAVLFGYSMYAGLGAVALWDADWPSLRARGIYRSLTEPRGVDCMDEYVTELLGYTYNSQYGRKLTRDLQGMMPVVLNAACYRLPDERPRNTTHLHNCMVALFYFGAVMEMQRLGMF